MFRVDWGWVFKLGYGGKYNSISDIDPSIWLFSYEFYTKSDIELSLQSTILNFYKIKFVFNFNFFDIVPLRAYLRWKRPSSMLTQANQVWDMNLKATTQFNKLGSIGFNIDDSINANFEKDLSAPVVKLIYSALEAAQAQVIYTTNQVSGSEDDTIDINPADFYPVFPNDFSYGDKLGW